jgi:hypothetical protein
MHRSLIALTIAGTLALTSASTSAREHYTNSTPPVACQSLAGWEDGSAVCQYGNAYWSYDPDEETYSVIDDPSVYLRVGIPTRRR